MFDTVIVIGGRYDYSRIHGREGNEKCNPVQGGHSSGPDADGRYDLYSESDARSDGVGAEQEYQDRSECVIPKYMRGRRGKEVRHEEMNLIVLHEI